MTERQEHGCGTAILIGLVLWLLIVLGIALWLR